jgi:hypothetical protein
MDTMSIFSLAVAILCFASIFIPGASKNYRVISFLFGVTNLVFAFI